jgi:hypothetical protein
MEDTMERTHGLVGNDNAPIPKDNKDRPFAKKDGRLADDTMTWGSLSSLLGMSALSSLPQLHVLSIVPFIAASNYWLMCLLSQCNFDKTKHIQ